MPDVKWSRVKDGFWKTSDDHYRVFRVDPPRRGFGLIDRTRQPVMWQHFKTMAELKQHVQALPGAALIEAITVERPRRRHRVSQ